jgi:hypothetical protein
LLRKLTVIGGVEVRHHGTYLPVVEVTFEEVEESENG